MFCNGSWLDEGERARPRVATITGRMSLEIFLVLAHGYRWYWRHDWAYQKLKSNLMMSLKFCPRGKLLSVYLATVKTKSEPFRQMLLLLRFLERQWVFTFYALDLLVYGSLQVVWTTLTSAMTFSLSGFLQKMITHVFSGKVCGLLVDITCPFMGGNQTSD